MNYYHQKCANCGTQMKPLFNVTLFCPNDCDKIHANNAVWYSWYCSQTVGNVVDNEMYLTMNIDMIKTIAEQKQAKIWEVKLEPAATIVKMGLGIYRGGPVRMIREVK